jgi:hypothetical protein
MGGHWFVNLYETETEAGNAIEKLSDEPCVYELVFLAPSVLAAPNRRGAR